MSIAQYKAAAESSAGHPSLRLMSARSWARLSFEHRVTSPLDAYRQVLALVPRVIWLGTAVDNQYTQVTREIDDIDTEAAAAAISLHSFDLAPEWLGAGRSLVWNQLFLLRNPLENQFPTDSQLVEELKQVSRDLDQASSLKSTDIPAVSPNGLSLEESARRHRRLAERWEQLISQARLLPGLQNFLRPKPASELMTSARGGAVVVINIHISRCDALILLPGESDITHVPLTEFSLQNAAAASAQLNSLLRSQGLIQRGFTQDRPEPKVIFRDILSMLWRDVVKPVLSHLNITRIVSTENLPHITWCTTGALSFLPLHAAGNYNDPESMLFNIAVSSYTPTLSALLKPRSAAAQFQGILAVGQAATPGFAPLPGTVAELDRIQEQSSHLPFTRPEGDSATAAAVLNAMEEHSWVHLSCHASQNDDDPTESAFHLHGGGLDLTAIAQKALRNARLAFLSACQIAMGDDELPEESIHLAAGMNMVGYPAMIATMWSVMDADAPLIVEKAYALMLVGGVPDSRKAASALHATVGILREKVGVKQFARWMPYIHIGL